MEKSKNITNDLLHSCYRIEDLLQIWCGSR